MKKTIALLLGAATLMSTVASAFTFPEPDWGALLNEKKQMVIASDFELYTEGSLSSVPYYNAKFEPCGGVYLGTVAENSEKFGSVSSYLTYIEDMYQNDLYYPANKMIKESNAVATIGWTINDVNNIDYNKVDSVLKTLNSYNKPMFVRFANEMNCSGLGDDPQKYIEIFRTVADLIHKYENLATVWSPNDLGALDRPFEYFYPGDEYVDWVGVSCYCIKYFMGNQNTSQNDSVYFMTGEYAWITNRLKPVIDFMKKNNIQKPVMISEGGVATNNKFGENLEGWATPRLRNMFYNVIMKYPQVKLINYFDVYRPDEVERFNISEYPYAVDIFNEALNCGAYITDILAAPDFAFVRADKGETLVAKDGKVNLYTLAYFPKTPKLEISYNIDGKWYASKYASPYKCELDISTLSDGKHTLEIRASDKVKKYTFFKRGTMLRFGAEPDINSIEIKVKLNGKRLPFDQAPVVVNGRTLVPLRAIFEALGAAVSWDDTTKTVTATKQNTTVSLTINKADMYVNNKAISLDVAPTLIGGRTLVPIRAVSEAFDCDVEWDDTTKTVILKN